MRTQTSEKFPTLLIPQTLQKTQQQQDSRLADRFANFKKGVELGKGIREREHGNRLERYRHFNAYAEENGAGEDARQRFYDGERKGVMAKCDIARNSTDDFEALRVIGRGDFGVVHLVRRKGTEEYYALKQIQKSGCRKKNYREVVFAERDFLTEVNSPWFVELFATFQDAENVYMVLEFLQGGSLAFHLRRRSKFTPFATQFYMAELLEALYTIHRCGLVHRDVKPSNMVLTGVGHLKLLGSGLCEQSSGLAADSSTETLNVGTLNLAPNILGLGGDAYETLSTETLSAETLLGMPQYVAPEVYVGDSGTASDIWSLGIITYECLVGEVPSDLEKVKSQILRHQRTMPQELVRRCREDEERYQQAKRRYQVPHEDNSREQSEKLRLSALKSHEEFFIANLVRNWGNFLKRVICEKSRRPSTEQCREDPFFEVFDFPRLHIVEAPICPEVRGSSDATNFDEFSPRQLPSAKLYAHKDSELEWTHFEFNREAHELQRPPSPGLRVQTMGY